MTEGVWSYLRRKAAEFFSLGEKRKRGHKEAKDQPHPDAAEEHPAVNEDRTTKRFKPNWAPAQPSRPVFGQITPRPVKPFGVTTPASGFSFKHPDSSRVQFEKGSGRFFTPRVDFKFGGAGTASRLFDREPSRFPILQRSTDLWSPAMSTNANRTPPLQAAKNAALVGTGQWQQRKPFPPRQEYQASAAGGMLPPGCLPVQEGLLSPDQRMEGERNLQKGRALQSLSALREKAKHSPSAGGGHQPAALSSPTFMPPRTAQGARQGDEEVIYQGETAVEGRARDEDAERGAQAQAARDRERKKQEKERQAAFQKQADAEKSRVEAERGEIKRYEGVHEKELLVRVGLAETEVEEERKKRQEAEKATQALQEQHDKQAAKLAEALQELAQFKPKTKTPLERAVEGTDGELLDKIVEAIDVKELVADEYSLDITREKLECMSDTVWLNSEVITFWLEWWREQHGGGSQTKMPQTDSEPRCWFANTYFYSKLLDDDKKTYKYANVKRWTRRIDIFACDKMIIPINDSDVHWFCACIDFRKKQTQVYDSMSGRHKHDAVHHHLRHWLQDEHQERKGAPLDLDEWSTFSPGDPGCDVPRQHNGCDCGVFSVLFCACCSVDREFDFSQGDIPLLRRWIVQTIYKVGEAKGQIAEGLCSV